MAEERVQRRLAAILAADVVGYSRLMGNDEAGTLFALKQHRMATETAGIAGWDCFVGRTYRATVAKEYPAIGGDGMKRTYEKPALVKAAVLLKIAALDACPTGYVYEALAQGHECVPEDEIK